MKTHSVRWNRAKTEKLIKLSPDFIELLKSSHRETVGMLLESLCSNCQKLTGVVHKVDADSLSDLSEMFPCPASSPECSVDMFWMKTTFQRGFVLHDLVDDLHKLDAFWSLWYDNRKLA